MDLNCYSRVFQQAFTAVVGQISFIPFFVDGTNDADALFLSFNHLRTNL